MALVNWIRCYPFPVQFGVVDSIKKLNLFLDDLGISHNAIENPTGNACTYEFFSRDGHLFCIVYLNPSSWDPYSIACVAAHEATHVAQNLWRHIKENTPGCEADAYLVQYVVEEIMTFCKDHHRVDK